MISPTFTPPNTYDWLAQRLALRARLQLRTVLRDLERSADASLVVLWAIEYRIVTQLLEFAGNDDAMPSPMPLMHVTVPSREPIRDRHGDLRDAVTYKMRLGGDAPALGIAVVEPGRQDSRVLFDLVEETGVGVEGIIIKSIERAERERHRARREEERRRRDRMRAAGW
jgi:hypothetical protein